MKHDTERSLIISSPSAHITFPHHTDTKNDENHSLHLYIFGAKSLTRRHLPFVGKRNKLCGVVFHVWVLFLSNC